MLVKLGKNQVTEYWADLKKAAKLSLPPFAGKREDVMNNLLEQLLSGEVEAWIIHDVVDAADGNKNATPVGVLYTTVITDISTQARSLLIYGIYAWAPLNKDMWLHGYDIIVRYAKSKKCTSVSGYTKDEGLLENAKKFGIDTEWRYLVHEV